jgi:hypothetical protein
MRSRRRRAGFSSSDLCAHRRDRRTISEVERLLTTPLPSITPTKPSPFRFADTLGMGPAQKRSSISENPGQPGAENDSQIGRNPRISIVFGRFPSPSPLPRGFSGHVARPSRSIHDSRFSILDSRFTFLNHSTFNLFLPRRSHFILFSPIKNGSFCPASGYN